MLCGSLFIYSSPPAMTTAYLFYLLCWITSPRLASLVAGEVYITSEPQHPVEGDTVLLKCIITHNQQNSSVFGPRECSVRWTWSSTPQENTEVVPISADSEQFTIVKVSSENDTLLEATLRIHECDTNLEGQYTCLWSCNSFTGSATLNLIMQILNVEDKQSETTVLVATTIAIAIILIILVSVTGWSIREHYTRKNRSSTDGQTPSDQDEETPNSQTYTEPPPKYSDAVASAFSPTPSGKDNDEAECKSQEADDDGVELDLLAPPNYETALSYLARNGNPFNPDSVQPMPPSYADAQCRAEETDT